MDPDSAKRNPLAPQNQKDAEFQPSRVNLAEDCDEEAMPELATSSSVPVGQAWNPEGETSDQVVHRRRGLCSEDIPALMEAVEKEITALAEARESNDKVLAKLRLKLSSLDKSVSKLTASLHPYHQTRNRFLSTFKKDKLGTATGDDWKIIAQGSFKPEAGDAATDALLYEGIMSRRDFTTFQKLYGLHPDTVRRISHLETLAVLSTHARVLASHKRTGSPRFYNLFNEFIRLFTESGMGYDVSYLVGDRTEVTNAYWEFVTCVKTEVTWVESGGGLLLRKQRKGSTDVVPGTALVPLERPRSRQQGPTAQPQDSQGPQQNADGDRSPSSPAPNQSPSSQLNNLASGRSAVMSPHDSSGTTSVLEENENFNQEMERLKHQNDWYSSELALARRAGYTPQTNGSAILDERANESLAEDDRPFIEAMLLLKGELSRVQGSVDTQAAFAAKRIQDIERQRDVAVQEAVYAKAKLAALGGNGTTPTSDKSAVDIANMDAEKMSDMSRKLASSLAAQAELSAKVEVLTAEITAERKARHLADETAAVAQSRVTELDDFRNRAASEMESLRAELLDAERAFRDEAAARAEATAEAKLLRIDQDELSLKLKEALEDNSGYQGSMGELRKAMEASSERSTTLARQLEEERLVKEGLERKLAQVKSEYEGKVADLTSTDTRLRDTEELMEKYAEEARAANAAMAAGLQKVSEREIMRGTGAADERVRVLQEQVASANSLLAKSKVQADETGERLAQAMQRVAGLEFQQGQASKDAIALRRRMAEVLDEVR
ncbi:hypothetical protein B9Z19DRAFT_1129131 [Tuber borchii]|uniref:Uncharacterized protein n=1 Tax=Tuber borchii TaxID=42251 RepID=A0A2T6ZMW5_TUBBO|nr:hypothetical protein B9Z19DRAFT_1129131 [Tuber borchii]